MSAPLPLPGLGSALPLALLLLLAALWALRRLAARGAQRRRARRGGRRRARPAASARREPGAGQSETCWGASCLVPPRALPLGRALRLVERHMQHLALHLGQVTSPAAWPAEFPSEASGSVGSGPSWPCSCCSGRQADLTPWEPWGALPPAHSLSRPWHPSRRPGAAAAPGKRRLPKPPATGPQRRRARKARLPVLGQVAPRGLEINVQCKHLQALWGGPTPHTTSLAQLVPPAPALHPASGAGGASVTFGTSRVSFLSAAGQAELDWHVRSKRLHQKGCLCPAPRAPLPPRPLHSARPGKTGADARRSQEPCVCPPALPPGDAGCPVALPPAALARLQHHGARKCVEIRAGAVPAAVSASHEAARARPPPALPRPLRPGQRQPRPGTCPALAPEAARRLELHLRQKWLRALWGLPAPPVRSRALLAPRAPCRPVPRAGGAPGVQLAEQDTPFLRPAARRSLEWHVRSKRLQCEWGPPPLLQRSLAAFLAPAPRPGARPPRPPRAVTVAPQELPFLSRGTQRELESHLIALQAQRRRGLPGRVAASLPHVRPPGPAGETPAQGHVQPPRPLHQPPSPGRAPAPQPLRRPPSPGHAPASQPLHRPPSLGHAPASRPPSPGHTPAPQPLRRPPSPGHAPASRTPSPGHTPAPQPLRRPPSPGHAPASQSQHRPPSPGHAPASRPPRQLSFKKADSDPSPLKGPRPAPGAARPASKPLPRATGPPGSRAAGEEEGSVVQPRGRSGSRRAPRPVQHGNSGGDRVPPHRHGAAPQLKRAAIASQSRAPGRGQQQLKVGTVLRTDTRPTSEEQGSEGPLRPPQSGPPPGAPASPEWLARAIVRSLGPERAARDLQLRLLGRGRLRVEYPVCLPCGCCLQGSVCPQHPAPWGQRGPRLLVYPKLSIGGSQGGGLRLSLGFLLKIKRKEASKWQLTAEPPSQLGLGEAWGQVPGSLGQPPKQWGPEGALSVRRPREQPPCRASSPAARPRAPPCLAMPLSGLGVLPLLPGEATGGAGAGGQAPFCQRQLGSGAGSPVEPPGGAKAGPTQPRWDPRPARAQSCVPRPPPTAAPRTPAPQSQPRPAAPRRRARSAPRPAPATGDTGLKRLFASVQRVWAELWGRGKASVPPRRAGGLPVQPAPSGRCPGTEVSVPGKPG